MEWAYGSDRDYIYIQFYMLLPPVYTPLFPHYIQS